jgi:hypothetical protein
MTLYEHIVYFICSTTFVVFFFECVNTMTGSLLTFFVSVVSGFSPVRATGVGGGETKEEGSKEEGKGEDVPQRPGNTFLMTTGGRDRCLFRWDTTFVELDPDAVPYEAKQTDGA